MTKPYQKLLFSLKIALSFVLILFFVAANAQELEVPQIDWEELKKTKPWLPTESWDEVNEVEINDNNVPGDAVVLFDGSHLENWQKPQTQLPADIPQIEVITQLMDSNYKGEPSNWVLGDGFMQSTGNWESIATKQSFGSIQLHLEWMIPEIEKETWDDYGNSGVILMGLYEVQILHGKSPIYTNGIIGSIYKQKAPLVNASKKPGQWQSYDIIFQAPEFDEAGELNKPAYITVIHNSVLIQNHLELKGPTLYIGESQYFKHAEKLPLILQDHGSKVKFRNVWIREL